MKKIKIKFYLSLIFLITTIFIVLYFNDYLHQIGKYFIPFFFICFLIDTLTVLFPLFNTSVSSGKHLNKFYIKTNNYNNELLLRQIKLQNRKSLLIFVLYFSILTIIGLSYAFIDQFKTEYLYIIFLAINLGDYFCILIWCPFKSLILKNTCCTRCRISNWDRLMKFYILIFIPNIYTITLVILGITIFITWEYKHYIHPERFYSLSNDSLSCKECSDTICKKK